MLMCLYAADDSGMRAAFPDDFDTLATNQDARRRRREKMKPADVSFVPPSADFTNSSRSSSKYSN